MSEWLFDLGNSRLKYARRDAGGAIGGMDSLDHRNRDFSDLPPEVRGEVAWVATVASPALRTGLLDELRTRFPRISLARTQATHGGLTIAYADPTRLGVDRFLALVAARDAGEAVLVIGVGTALTIDLLDADGQHRGGRIAPSPSLMRQSLHARAAQLPAAGGDYVEFADDTVDALASGCEGAALALIERSRTQAQARLGAAARLWLHGGGADALTSRLDAAEERPRLVLEGLSSWAGHSPEWAFGPAV